MILDEGCSSIHIILLASMIIANTHILDTILLALLVDGTASPIGLSKLRPHLPQAIHTQELQQVAQCWNPLHFTDLAYCTAVMNPGVLRKS